MKTSMKIFLKFTVLLFFIVVSPLFQSIQATVQSIELDSLFNQRKQIKTINLQAFNVMDMVRREDIPEKEMDVIPDDEIAEIPEKHSSKKSVYIYSTHQRETYKDKTTVVEASYYLKTLLEQKGIEVIVEDRDFTKELNDAKLDYNKSYQISRNAIHEALIEHQGFDLIIDFHRDSVPRASSFISVNDKNYAKLMIVLGGLSQHFDIIQQKAMTLFDKTNQLQSGIMKNILVREAYYNQDISEKMLLIEVGSDENYYEEVKNSLNVLSESIHEMLR